MKRLLTLTLCASILLSAFLTGCNQNSDETPDSTDTDAATATTAEKVEETTVPEVLETEAGDEVETTEQPPVEDETEETEGNIAEKEPEEGISRNLSSVSIQTGDSAAEVYAASELQKYLEMKGVSVAEDAYLMTLRIDPSMKDDSYKIQVFRKKGDGTVITGGNARGMIYGVYRFLEDQAGIRFFTPDLEVIPEGPMSVTTGTTVFEPIFDKRSFDWYVNWCTSSDWMVKNGINDCPWFGPFQEKYGGSWESTGVSCHTLGMLTETGDSGSPNPCLTDPENLRKAIANLRKMLEDNPNLNYVSVSQNDCLEYCHCENCAAVDAEEGSPSGTMLRFVNAVAADIAEDYPYVTVDTLAYQYTQKAPKITKPLPNVAVRLCTVYCHFTHPISDKECSNTAAFNVDFEEWSKICDNIYIWDYTTNYRYCIPTYANLTVIRENMQYFADNNVRGMFPEGNYFSLSGEFGELRAYLLAKLMMDPYMSERDYYTHMDEFLAAYYGKGWKYIRAYIDSTSALAARGCQSIYDETFKGISEEDYLLMEEHYEEWWSKAEELAGDRFASVQRSRLQWRYIKLMLHPNEEDARALIADVNAAGVAWGEGRVIPDDVDLTKPPHEWYS